MSPYDQQVYDAGFKFIPQTQYLQNPFLIPQGETTTDSNTGAGIVTLPMSRGIDGVRSLQINDPMMNFDNFYDYTGNKYMMNQDRPNLDIYSDNAQKTFMGFPSFREQELTGADIGEYIGSGTNIPLEQTMAGSIQSKIGDVTGGIKDLIGKVPSITGLLNRIGVQNFESLSPADQLFIKTNTGYRGPTVFGANTSGLNVDPFGLNVESLFGNYAEAVRDNFSQLQDTLTKNRPGVTFNELTGEFEGDDDDLVDKTNKQTQMIRKKFLFRQKQIQQQEKNKRDAQKRAAQEAAERNRIQASLDRGGYDSTSGRADRDRRNVTEASAAATSQVGGGGYTASDSNRDAARGRYMMGGLADMLEIYD